MEIDKHNQEGFKSSRREHARHSRKELSSDLPADAPALLFSLDDGLLDDGRQVAAVV